DRRLEIGRRLGNRPALAERVGSLPAARVHDANAIAAPLAVERVRVEVADQPGPEHRDAVGLHRATSSVTGCRALAPRTRSRPWPGEGGFWIVRWRAVWLNPQSGTSVSRSGGTPVSRTASILRATSSGVSTYEFFTSITPAATSRPAAVSSRRTSSSASSRF